MAWFLAVVMAVSCLAGCSQQGAPSSSGSGQPQGNVSGGGDEGFTGTIKFGIGCPLTGTSASYGELMLLGANMAAEELNEAGGIQGMKVEIVAYDDKQDPNEAALVAQRFCDNEEIYAVISHGGSGLTMAAAPIYEEAKLTNMAPSSSASLVTEQGHQYLVRHVIREIGRAHV